MLKRYTKISIQMLTKAGVVPEEEEVEAVVEEEGE